MKPFIQGGIVCLLSLLLFFLLQKSSFIQTSPKHFVIVICSYNNKDWYIYNLNSVFSQTYPHYRVIYIDDCSPDNTHELVKEYLTTRNLEHVVTLIKNDQREGAMFNHYQAIQLCKDNEIIVCLDGDDWFAQDDVLEYLSNIYADESIWLTYGQFCNWPTGERGWCEEIPQHIIDSHSFREFGFVSVQLRTYYAWLAKQVKLEDLISEHSTNCSFFPIACDVALMFPMLEMAAHHFKFITKILCQRNVATPINDFKMNPELQINTMNFIAAKKSYCPLTRPLFKHQRSSYKEIACSINKDELIYLLRTTPSDYIVSHQHNHALASKKIEEGMQALHKTDAAFCAIIAKNELSQLSPYILKLPLNLETDIYAFKLNSSVIKNIAPQVIIYPKELVTTACDSGSYENESTLLTKISQHLLLKNDHYNEKIGLIMTDF